MVTEELIYNIQLSKEEAENMLTVLSLYVESYTDIGDKTEADELACVLHNELSEVLETGEDIL